LHRTYDFHFSIYSMPEGKQGITGITGYASPILLSL